jgi:N-acetylglucosamine-6-sulfatase
VHPQFRYVLNRDGQLVRHGIAPEDYLTGVLAADAVQFVKQKPGTPFFLEVATFSPHAPYAPAPRDANAFPNLHAPQSPAYNVPHDPAAPHWLAAIPARTQPNTDGIDRDFRKRAQSAPSVDNMIGELEAAVASIGQEKNTYVIFSSDNGYHMGECVAHWLASHQVNREQKTSCNLLISVQEVYKRTISYLKSIQVKCELRDQFK